MQSNINDLVKPVEKNGQVLTHQDTSYLGVNGYRCSTFIKNKNVLVKGEMWNQHKENRNAMILLLDGNTGKIIGKSRVSMEANQKVEERHHLVKMCCLWAISSGTARSTFWHRVVLEVVPIYSSWAFLNQADQPVSHVFLFLNFGSENNLLSFTQ